ncbi:MAG: hypothetical protein UFS73_07640 [Weissella confusa]|nr:hypothetical protein [Weissella confusa]
MISEKDFRKISLRYSRFVEKLQTKLDDVEIIYVSPERDNMLDTKFLFVGESPYLKKEEVTPKSFESVHGTEQSGNNLNEMAKTWLLINGNKESFGYSGLLNEGKTIFEMSKQLKINFINAYPIVIVFETKNDCSKKLFERLKLSKCFYVEEKKRYGKHILLIDVKGGWLDTLVKYYWDEHIYMFGVVASDRWKKGIKVMHPVLSWVNFGNLYAEFLGPKSIFADVFNSNVNNSI